MLLHATDYTYIVHTLDTKSIFHMTSSQPLQTIDKAVLVSAAKLATLPEEADADAINAAMSGVKTVMRRSTAVGWKDMLEHPPLVEAVRGDLRFLRKSLDELLNEQMPSDRQKWQSLLNSAVLAPVLTKDGTKAIPTMTGVASIVAYALVLLTDSTRDLRRRFGRCKKCGKYFFAAPHTGRGRHRTEFCSTPHARLWAQLEYLKRQKAAKHK